METGFFEFTPPLAGGTLCFLYLLCRGRSFSGALVAPERAARLFVERNVAIFNTAMTEFIWNTTLQCSMCQMDMKYRSCSEVSDNETVSFFSI